jgi:hypothetical protein
MELLKNAREFHAAGKINCGIFIHRHVVKEIINVNRGGNGIVGVPCGAVRESVMDARGIARQCGKIRVVVNVIEVMSPNREVADLNSVRGGHVQGGTRPGGFGRSPAEGGGNGDSVRPFIRSQFRGCIVQGDSKKKPSLIVRKCLGSLSEE